MLCKELYSCGIFGKYLFCLILLYGLLKYLIFNNLLFYDAFPFFINVVFFPFLSILEGGLHHIF